MLREELTSTLFIIIAQQWPAGDRKNASISYWFLVINDYVSWKNAQVSRRRFSVGIGIHKLIFFRQAFALSEKKNKKEKICDNFKLQLAKIYL